MSRQGVYIGPAGQRVTVKYDDGPGFNTGCLMYRIGKSKIWHEVTDEFWFLLKGWKRET